MQPVIGGRPLLGLVGPGALSSSGVVECRDEEAFVGLRYPASLNGVLRGVRGGVLEAGASLCRSATCLSIVVDEMDEESRTDEMYGRRRKKLCNVQKDSLGTITI